MKFVIFLWFSHFFHYLEGGWNRACASRLLHAPCPIHIFFCSLPLILWLFVYRACHVVSQPCLCGFGAIFNLYRTSWRHHLLGMFPLICLSPQANPLKPSKAFLCLLSYMFLCFVCQVKVHVCASLFRCLLLSIEAIIGPFFSSGMYQIGSLKLWFKSSSVLPLSLSS